MQCEVTSDHVLLTVAHLGGMGAGGGGGGAMLVQRQVIWNIMLSVPSTVYCLFFTPG